VRLLVVGGGGREHALCHALRRENADAILYAAPGNPGTASLAENLPISPGDLDRLADAADMLGIDLTVIGPEAPLAAGLADRLRAEGRAVVGPSAAAAQIEASKAFAKEVMAAAGVPTASSAVFTELVPALAYVESHPEPLVVKASGLAAGKGAIVCATRREAASAVRAMLGELAFGDAGRVVLIEAFLEGEELSVMLLTDGTGIELLPAAQDHKRLLEGDRGPNTGGMGAYSPVTVATPELLRRAVSEVCLPVLSEMKRRGTPFSGVLYAGLMVSPAGDLAVVEFNCRLGDPETQVVLPLVEAGLTDALWRIGHGSAPSPLRISGGTAVTTVLAAAGYPDRPEPGAEIGIPEDLPENVVVFHAGTARSADGLLRVAGGRVLAVTGLAAEFGEAQRASRDVAAEIQFSGKQFRSDIGWREAARRQAVGGRSG
jgi:phosphoribosylamine--glycine ligase